LWPPRSKVLLSKQLGKGRAGGNLFLQKQFVLLLLLLLHHNVVEESAGKKKGKIKGDWDKCCQAKGDLGAIKPPLGGRGEIAQGFIF
jgi:hypothetical protein